MKSHLWITQAIKITVLPDGLATKSMAPTNISFTGHARATSMDQLRFRLNVHYGELRSLSCYAGRHCGEPIIVVHVEVSTVPPEGQTEVEFCTRSLSLCIVRLPFLTVHGAAYGLLKSETQGENCWWLYPAFSTAISRFRETAWSGLGIVEK